MSKRFALSAAGMAATAMTGSALADGDAVVTVHGDAYLGEASLTMVSSGGNALGFFISGNSVIATSSGSIVQDFLFENWNPSASSAYTSGYRLEWLLTDATGDYTISMLDTYGDGWAWANVSGADAFVINGDVSGDTTIGFASGASAGGNVRITPAPGALALLGLAGLAGRRKRS